MSDTPVIRFDRVSKMYHMRAGMGTLFSRLPGFRRPRRDEFWALKDVSFDVKKGECLGIIGPNGAGKSTILKILSRITPPTSGRYEVRGRLSSLIEVGAGFHPELTGRENVYLNAAIVGMSKRETAAKFKDIVDFAELWDFIDVPVKRYSSGMYVRLGFSVAIHMEPEVLLIDEVLSVGDASFRRKCQHHITELKKSGVTIVFVSHNTHAVTGLCNSAICLVKGRIAYAGAPADAVSVYERESGGVSRGTALSNSKLEAALVAHSQVARDSASGEAVFSDVQVCGMDGRQKDSFAWDEPVVIRATFQTAERVDRPIFIAGCCALNGDVCCVLKSTTAGVRPDFVEGKGTIEISFESLPLFTGNYVLLVGLFDETHTVPLAYRRDTLIHISNPSEWFNERDGFFTPRARWDISGGSGTRNTAC